MNGWEPGVRRFLLQQKYQRTRPVSVGTRTANGSGASSLDIALPDIETRLRHLFTGCSDVVFRPLSTWGVAVWCNTMTEGDMTVEHLLAGTPTPAGAAQLADALRPRLQAQGTSAQTYEDLVAGVLGGSTAILLGGTPGAWLLQGKQSPGRQVAEPQSEIAVRGPRDGFVEDLRVNLSLIRRRLRHPTLKVETVHVGRLTQTAVSLLWIEGIAPESILGEVRRRVGAIDVDMVLEGAYLEEYIEDHPYSPFPTILHTERPDRVTAALAEGRIAIVVEGTPFVMTVPALMTEFLQASDDYYQGFYVATLMRWVRVGGLIITMVLPALYVALTAFHQELLPTPLLLSTASAREGVPMPAVVEALLMQFIFEIVREAGLRMPRPISSAVTIVGALVIGESAVRAGLISAPMVIVVSLTALSSFVLPSYHFMLAFRLVSVGLIALAGIFGLLGILAGEIALLIHLCGLRSFGVPYTQPLAPYQFKSLKDVLVRAPLFAMRRRPEWAQNQIRTEAGQQPAPPGGPTGGGTQ